MIDLLALFAAAEEASIGQVTSCGSTTMSFGIVNSSGNGKRVSISKTLAEKLQLTNTLKLVPVVAQNRLIIGNEVPNRSPMVCNLRSQGERKIGYSAGIVEALTRAFSLDFSSHTSKTFTSITIESYKDSPIAVITIHDQHKDSNNAADDAKND